MRIASAVFALLLVAGTSGKVKSQNFSNIKTGISKQNSAVFSAIKSIVLTPFAIINRQLRNTADEKLNTDASDKTKIETISARLFKYAMLMNVEVESLTDAHLYSFIDEWYGTHYRMGGTTKKGIDCSAFTGTLLSTVFSFFVPRTAREQYQICEHIKKEDLLSGDLVFFNTTGGVSHVGVYLGNNHFVHSSSSQGVTVSSLDDEYYSRKFIGGGRVNQ